MSKVTTKLQVTIPKKLAESYGIAPGCEVQFEPAGPVIRLVPPRAVRPPLSVEERLRIFDEATARQEVRNHAYRAKYGDTRITDRGWTREDLYDRGRAD